MLVPVRRSGTCVEETTPDFSRQRDDVGKRKENGITKRSSTRDISTSFSPARPFILAPQKWISCCFQRFVLSGKTNRTSSVHDDLLKTRSMFKCLNVSSGYILPVSFNSANADKRRTQCWLLIAESTTWRHSPYQQKTIAMGLGRQDKQVS